jgi:hypothetical protein
MPDVRLTVRCVACKAARQIAPGEVPDDEMPMCDKCFMPMVAESATADLKENT